jgi:hypothetical protein
MIVVEIGLETRRIEVPQLRLDEIGAGVRPQIGRKHGDPQAPDGVGIPDRLRGGRRREPAAVVDVPAEKVTGRNPAEVVERKEPVTMRLVVVRAVAQEDVVGGDGLGEAVRLLQGLGAPEVGLVIGGIGGERAVMARQRFADPAARLRVRPKLYQLAPLPRFSATARSWQTIASGSRSAALWQYARLSQPSTNSGLSCTAARKCGPAWAGRHQGQTQPHRAGGGSAGQAGAPWRAAREPRRCAPAAGQPARRGGRRRNCAGPRGVPARRRPPPRSTGPHSDARGPAGGAAGVVRETCGGRRAHETASRPRSTGLRRKVSDSPPLFDTSSQILTPTPARGSAQSFIL